MTATSQIDASMFVKAFFGRDFGGFWWLLLRVDKTGMGRSWWRAGFYQVTKFSSFERGPGRPADRSKASTSAAAD
jgi:hypothetical protein